MNSLSFSSFVKSHEHWSLDPITEVLRALGNPQERVAPLIHITGTNGKGSSLAFLRACLKAQGLRVQTYLSPHLVSVRERITLVQGPVDLQDLEEALRSCLRYQKTPLSFFEALTASAYLLFSQESADVVLMEVGMGGRLDATNVATTTCASLITSISLDHTALLGPTTEAIAREKAAIMRANTPCISAKQDPLASQALQTHASSLPCPLFLSGRDWFYQLNQGGMEVIGPWGSLSIPHIGLKGAHQKENAAGVVATLMMQKAMTITQDSLMQGLATASWPGRLDRRNLKGFPKESEIWLDGAHNIGGVKALGSYVKTWQTPFILVLGVLARKDPQPFLDHLIPLSQEVWIVEQFGSEPTLQAETFAQAGKKMRVFATWQALMETHGLSQKTTLLVTGSLYLLGDVLLWEQDHA